MSETGGEKTRKTDGFVIFCYNFILFVFNGSG